MMKVFGSRGEALAWLGLMLAAAVVMYFTVLTVRASRAESGEHWKIVANIHSSANPDQTIHLTYGTKEHGAHYFASEAACKKEVADPKSEFNTKTWTRILAFAKQAGDVADKPMCVLDLTKDGA